MPKSNFDSVETLSHRWAGRYASLKPRYQGKTLEFLNKITRGRQNGFEPVVAKSDAVNSSTGEERNYNRSLTAGFQLNVKVEPRAISDVVCGVRSKFNYKRFTGNVNRQCIDELRKVFILNEVTELGRDGKNHVVYVPVFALLVE
jgi:hypothetical protein